MMSWTQLLTGAGMLGGGAAGAEIVRGLSNKSRTKAENHRDDAQAEAAVSRAALDLLEPYKAEVKALQARVAALETDREVDRKEQSRVTGLLRHACEVLRDCLEVLREHSIPAPAMSDELLAEISGAV